jgi:serine/threonine protein phosphatase PrpC
MPDKKPKFEVNHGDLKEARFYVGNADSHHDVINTKLGDVAVSTIGDHEKAGPNEDSAAVIPVNDEYMVLIVADGVGGMAGARRASNLTVETIATAIANLDETTGTKLRTAILDGIEAANQAVLDLGGRSASTLALAEVGPDYIRTYHVGDSILLLTGQRGLVKMVTTPHSPVGFAMEAGLIDENEALQHNELNLIFNVIGSTDMRIEIGSELPIAARDTLLIASDGLTDNVRQEESVEIIRKGSIEEAMVGLTEIAQKRMQTEAQGRPSKPDDFTTILFRPKS